MKIDRRKILFMIIGAIAVVVALFGVGKIVQVMTTPSVDTAEGVELIQTEEAQDVQSIEAKIQEMEAQEKADEEADAKRTNKQKFVNSVVMGDSIAYSFAEYDVLDASSVVAKIGVSIVSIDEDLATVEQMVPDAIFLSYGMNDITNTNGDAQVYREQYKSVIDELKKELPNSRIFVNSIFPVQQKVLAEQPEFENLAQYNEMLSELCDEEKITFIDNTSLVEEKYYEPDGIHFVAEFYPIWADRMAEVASL